ncbi:MAG: hypothetical protein R3E95_02470 [Thiolinea sp.]
MCDLAIAFVLRYAGVWPRAQGLQAHQLMDRSRTLTHFAQHFSHERLGPGRLALPIPPHSLTSLTASTLNTRLNLRLCMTHLRLHETPHPGVHQTGSSSVVGISVLAKPQTDFWYVVQKADTVMRTAGKPVSVHVP